MSLRRRRTPQPTGAGGLFTKRKLPAFFTVSGETEDQNENSGEARRLAEEISPVYYVDENTLPSVFAYAGNDPIVTKGNRESMTDVFEKTFGKNGNRYRYVFYPLSGHGLLLDPISENIYDQAVYEYCETYFGY